MLQPNMALRERNNSARVAFALPDYGLRGLDAANDLNQTLFDELT